MLAENIPFQVKKDTNGTVRPKFQRYQARAFLTPSSLEEGKKKYQVIIERWEASALKEDRDKTLHVWSTYDSLMTLVGLQYPSLEQQNLIDNLSFQHMLAFRLKYGAEDVTYYLHVLFSHAPAMMKKYGSIGLYKNESDECLHSEDKNGCKTTATAAAAGLLF